jgi:HEXXH motif-containing protein
LSAATLPENEETCRHAIGVLQEYAPSYVSWIGKVARLIVPLDGTDGTLRSTSDAWWPGGIGLSFPARAVAAAEMLVHESSHQYLHILGKLEPLCDASDERVYYSPATRTTRPLGAILLAFHAFANVVLFYRSCMSAGLDDNGYCKAGETRHLPELEAMARDLRSSSSLTGAGTAVFEQLVAKAL